MEPAISTWTHGLLYRHFCGDHSTFGGHPHHPRIYVGFEDNLLPYQSLASHQLHWLRRKNNDSFGETLAVLLQGIFSENAFMNNDHSYRWKIHDTSSPRIWFFYFLQKYI